MTMKNEMDLVLIEWVDSHGPVDGWRIIDNSIEPEPLICESVGWLLYNGKNCKKVLPHRAGYKSEGIDEQGRGELTIPTKAILAIKKLKY
jgi:hypothetical protein